MNPSDAKTWIEYARSDLGAAHTLLEEVTEDEARATLRLAEAVF